MELTSILNIEPIGHRKRIMKSIRDLRTLQSSYDEAEKRVKIHFYHLSFRRKAFRRFVLFIFLTISEEFLSLIVIMIKV